LEDGLAARPLDQELGPVHDDILAHRSQGFRWIEEQTISPNEKHAGNGGETSAG
jgi:hypothetical protein